MNLSIGIDSIFADHKFLFLTPVKRVLGNRFEDRINWGRCKFEQRSQEHVMQGSDFRDGVVSSG